MPAGRGRFTTVMRAVRLRRLVFALLVLTGFLGCSACRDFARADALEHYTRKLIEKSKAGLSGGGCAMPGVRRGFCILSGEKRQLLILADHLGLTESSVGRAPEESSCGKFHAFGAADPGRAVPLEPISELTPSEPIATGIEDVHLVAMYVGSFAGCLEFEQRNG